MYKLSFIEQAVARLLLPARCGKDLRPQLQGVREGVEDLNHRLHRFHRNLKTKGRTITTSGLYFVKD
jgi:hypothetical protein